MTQATLSPEERNGRPSPGWRCGGCQIQDLGLLLSGDPWKPVRVRHGHRLVHTVRCRSIRLAKLVATWPAGHPDPRNRKPDQADLTSKVGSEDLPPAEGRLLGLQSIHKI